MIVSIHHYELAKSATDREFQDAVQEAEQRELFDLPGLTEYQFLHGIKGKRENEYTALWMYEDRRAWQDLWGPVDDPVPPDKYPDNWKVWEEELLAPIIVGNPNKINHTSYETITTSSERDQV